MHLLSGYVARYLYYSPTYENVGKEVSIHIDDTIREFKEEIHVLQDNMRSNYQFITLMRGKGDVIASSEPKI